MISDLTGESRCNSSSVLSWKTESQNLYKGRVAQVELKLPNLLSICFVHSEQEACRIPGNGTLEAECLKQQEASGKYLAAFFFERLLLYYLHVEQIRLQNKRFYLNETVQLKTGRKKRDVTFQRETSAHPAEKTSPEHILQLHEMFMKTIVDLSKVRFHLW